MNRVVVLGCGTGVGKTQVSSSLVRTLAPNALGLKPVESGVSDGAPADAEALARAGGLSLAPPRYSFRDPVSPHLAARTQGEVIRTTEVKTWVEDHERRTCREWTVVETAGGAFSPLGPNSNNVDLALGLGPAAWVLVAADRLGALHDVLSCLQALQVVARLPEVVVLNRLEPGDTSNRAELAALGCPVEVVPHDFEQRTNPRLLQVLISRG